MTEANQMTPMPTVSRSRFRSATDEPPRELERPPPRPLCRRTSMIISRLVAMRMIVKRRSTARSYVTPGARPKGCSQHWHVVVPADAAELVGLQARPAHQAPVHVGLRHDRGHVGRLDRAAVEDAYGVRSGVPVRGPALFTNRRAHLLRVVGRGHLTRPDGPDRLVG